MENALTEADGVWEDDEGTEWVFGSTVAALVYPKRGSKAAVAGCLDKLLAWIGAERVATGTCSIRKLRVACAGRLGMAPNAGGDGQGSSIHRPVCSPWNLI